MYIHLGGETVIRSSEIIGIFDLENTSISARTRHFLKCAEESGQVVNVSPDLPASFVVVAGKNGRGTKVYISQLSSVTLRKRALEKGYTTAEIEQI